MNYLKQDKIAINSNYNIIIGSRTQYSSMTKSHIIDTLNNFIEKKLVDEIVEKLYNGREKKIINNLEIKKK